MPRSRKVTSLLPVIPSSALMSSRSPLTLASRRSGFRSFDQACLWPWSPPSPATAWQFRTHAVGRRPQGFFLCWHGGSGGNRPDLLVQTRNPPIWRSFGLARVGPASVCCPSPPCKAGRFPDLGVSRVSASHRRSARFAYFPPSSETSFVCRCLGTLYLRADRSGPMTARRICEGLNGSTKPVYFSGTRITQSYLGHCHSRSASTLRIAGSQFFWKPIRVSGRSYYFCGETPSKISHC